MAVIVNMMLHFFYALCATSVALHLLSLLLGKHVWWLDLFTHFQLQWLVVFAVLLGLGLYLHQYVAACALFVYCIVLLAWVAPSQFTTTHQPNNIDLYFHNVLHHTSAQTQEQQADVIASAADTIALVEPSSALVDLVSERIGPPILHHDDGGLSGAIWHSDKSQVDSFATLPLTSHDPVFTVSFSDYDLYVTHPIPPLTHQRAKRQQSAFQTVAGLVRHSQSVGRDWLVVGDFNSSTYSPVFRQYFGKHSPDRLYTWQWPTPLTIPIDYAFGSNVDNVQKLPAYGSDHQAVGVSFRP